MEKALMLFIVLHAGTGDHMVDAVRPSPAQTAASDAGVPMTVDVDWRQEDDAIIKLRHSDPRGSSISIVSR